MDKTKSKRRNKNFEQQAKYYEVGDFKFFMINQWIFGYSIYEYYMELNQKCRFEFISWLLYYTPHPDWTKIILYLLNPETKKKITETEYNYGSK